MSHWKQGLHELTKATPQVIPPGTPTCGCGEFLVMEKEREARQCSNCEYEIYVNECLEQLRKVPA